MRSSSQKNMKVVLSLGYSISKQGILYNKKKIAIGSINSSGYISTIVRINGKGVMLKAHRLQAYIKYGDVVFNSDIVVRHLNGIKTDNTWDNILIGTYSENSMDIPIDLRKSRVLSSVVRKYDYESVILFYNKTKSYKQTMVKFNMPQRSSLTRVLQSQL